MIIRDATVAADYVASWASFYQGQIARPWPEVVQDVRQDVQAVIDQANKAIRAAKDAGVKHLIWSTLPDVETISGGKFNVPHFTGKAKVDSVVKAAGFASPTIS